MNVIYKYPLSLNPAQILQLPVGFIPLHVAVQRGTELQLWCRVDPHIIDRVAVRVDLCTTGVALPEDVGEYLGTVHLFAGAAEIILHVHLHNV